MVHTQAWGRERKCKITTGTNEFSIWKDLRKYYNLTYSNYFPHFSKLLKVLFSPQS